MQHTDSTGYYRVTTVATCVMAKRVDLSLAQKVALLKELEVPGTTQVSVAVKFGVSTSQVSRLVKNKDELVRQYDGGANTSRKRQRGSKEDVVGRALFVWFQQKLSQGARLSGPLIKQKARELSQAHGGEFTPSEGWLSRWKVRNNVVFKKEHGEKADADVDAATTWKESVLTSITANFSANDIFNADETGLYFRGYPEKGHCVKGSSLSGGKKAKDRITVLLCANMSGTEKYPLLVVGKSKRPRCFPADPKLLPVDYDHSKNAWMTGDMFRRWLQKWDTSLRAKKRKICLMVDNCPAHPADVPLTNIVLKFLPPNTTSIMQPMDMGVIKNWKGHYRSLLASRVVAALDADPEKNALEVVRKVSLLDVLHLAKQAWDLVSMQTISNCFRKGSFCEEEVSPGDELSDVVVPSEMAPQAFEEFVTFDDSTEVFGELTNEELLEVVQESSTATEKLGSDEENEPQLLTLTEKMQMVDCLRQYIQETAMDTALSVFHQIESAVYAEASQAKRQRTLDSFFN